MSVLVEYLIVSVFPLGDMYGTWKVIRGNLWELLSLSNESNSLNVYIRVKVLLARQLSELEILDPKLYY